MKSIRMKITVVIVFCSFVTASVISLLAISGARNISNTAAEKELILNCSNAGREINALISRIEQSVDTLSAIALERLDSAAFFQSNDEYVTAYTDNLLEDFYTFAEHTDGAITAYIRYNPEYTDPTSGIFLMRDNAEAEFESVTPTDFSMYDPGDTAHVGWYYIPVANKAPIWMDPYLNENVHIYMISYVVPLYVDGVSVGILGMDIDFGQLTALTDKVSAFDTGYAFLMDSKGDILHHRELESGTDLQEYNAGEMASVKDFVLDEYCVGRTLEYTCHGTDKYLAYQGLDNSMKLALTAPLTEIKANADDLTIKVVTASLAANLLAIVLGVVLGSFIANPIKKMTEIIKQTSRLNFRKTDENDQLAKIKDETGVMATAVSEMRGVIRDLINQMEAVKDSLGNNMNRLDEVMRENNRISEDNSATTQELAAGMEETTASAMMIVENIGAIQANVADIQELSANEQQNSKEIMTRARQLRDNTVASKDKAMSIYADMKMRTEEAIEKARVVAKINELTDHIREISSQTNLLALNANIEAARAGEAGRGFAVVATEIGDLASKTFETVNGINQMVQEVKDAVTGMTECIRVIIGFLEETVVEDYGAFGQVGERYEKDAASFADSMQQIYQEISDLNRKMNAIADTVEAVNHTISESTTGVNVIAEKSSDAVQKIVEGYNHLRESEGNLVTLKSLIEKFEL